MPEVEPGNNEECVSVMVSLSCASNPIVCFVGQFLLLAMKLASSSSVTVLW